MGYYEFPHTRNYDTDLGYLIKRYFELSTDFESLEKNFNDLKVWCLSQLNSEALKTLVANKLDEWLADGTLEALINNPLNHVTTYDTIVEMLTHSALLEGSKIYCAGADTVNDGKGGHFRIRARLSSDVIDNYNLYLIDGSIKVAERITDILINYVTPEMFGAIGDGVTDDSEAIQSAINYLANGGCIYFGSKTYLCNSELTASKSIVFKGNNRESTKLKYTGSSTFIDQTSGDVLGFENILLMGTSDSNGNIFKNGSICYKAYNNSYSENSEFLYWNTVSYWKGGYYHKHINSMFRYNKIIFDNYDQNNLSFFGCSFSNFETGIIIKSGEGPISFIGGSIEFFAQKVFVSTSERSICVNLIGVYVEEGPNESCPSGIESSTGKFDMGFMIYSNGLENYSINIIGCTVFVSGIFRFLYRYEPSNSPGITFTSKGNTFISRGLTTNVDCIYDIGGSANSSVDVHDTIVGDFEGGFAKYISGYNDSNLERCIIFDPITRKYLKSASV